MAKHFRYFLLTLLILTTIFLGELLADSGNSSEEFQQGLLCYGEINFTCALDYFTRAEKSEKAIDSKSARLVEIYKYKAFSEVALGKDKAAEESFKKALMINPDFQLSEEKVSPGILEIYQDAKNQIEVVLMKQKQQEELKKAAEEEKKKRAEEKRKEQNKAKQEEPVKPEPVEWLLGLNVAGSFVLGEDMDYFEPGFMLGLDCSYLLHSYFAIGGEISYTRNASKSSRYGSLNNLSLMVKPAFMLVDEQYIFKLPLAVGFSTYGFGDIESRQGLTLKLEPAIFYRVHKNFALGIFAGAGTVLYFQDNASSWFINTGASLLATF